MSEHPEILSQVRSYRQALQEGAEHGRQLLRSQSYAMHAEIAGPTSGNVLRIEGWTARLLEAQLSPDKGASLSRPHGQKPSARFRKLSC